MAHPHQLEVHMRSTHSNPTLVLMLTVAHTLEEQTDGALSGIEHAAQDSQIYLSQMFFVTHMCPKLIIARSEQSSQPGARWKR